jgi:hypothetical protein
MPVLGRAAIRVGKNRPLARMRQLLRLTLLDVADSELVTFNSGSKVDFFVLSSVVLRELPPVGTVMEEIIRQMGGKAGVRCAWSFFNDRELARALRRGYVARHTGRIPGGYHKF